MNDQDVHKNTVAKSMAVCDLNNGTLKFSNVAQEHWCKLWAQFSIWVKFLNFSLAFLAFPSCELWPWKLLFEFQPIARIFSWILKPPPCVLDPLGLCLVFLFVSSFYFFVHFFSSFWSCYNSTSQTFGPSIVQNFKVLVLLLISLPSCWSFCLLLF